MLSLVDVVATLAVLGGVVFNTVTLFVVVGIGVVDVCRNVVVVALPVVKVVAVLFPGEIVVLVETLSVVGAKSVIWVVGAVSQIVVCAAVEVDIADSSQHSQQHPHISLILVATETEGIDASFMDVVLVVDVASEICTHVLV